MLGMMHAFTFPTLFAALLVALLTPAPTYAQNPGRPRACVCDNNVCVFLSDGSTPNTLQVVVEGPPDAKWLGIGFANSMASGDSYIGMTDAANKAIVSRRRLVGQRAPQVLPQADQHATTSGSVFGLVNATNKFVVQFVRPKTGVDIGRPVNVIFAYSTQVVNNPGPTAAILVHQRSGRLTLDLNNGVQQANHDTRIANNRDAISKFRNGGATGGNTNSPSPSPTAPEGGEVKADSDQGKGAMIPPAAGATPGSGATIVSATNGVVMGVAVGSAAAVAWLLA